MAIGDDSSSVKHYGFSPCDDRDVRVVFNPSDSDPFELPIVDEGVKTYVDKGDVATIERETEMYFPLEWGNETNLLQHVDPGEYPNEWIPANVQYRYKDTETGDWIWDTAHYGFVQRVGSSASAGKLRLWIGDWAELIGGIRLNKKLSYTDSSSVGDVYSDVVSVVRNRLKHFDSSNFESSKAQYEPVDVEENWYLNFIPENFQFDIGLDETKDFPVGTELKDVLDWACDVSNGYWYVEYDDENQTTILTYEDRDDSRSVERTKYVAQNVTRTKNEMPITVYENNALYELSPTNTIKVIGKSGSNNTVPEFLAQHALLYERAGTEIGGTFEIDASTKSAAKRLARKKLKEEITSASGGEMVVEGRPRMKPFSQIRTPPACKGVVNTSTIRRQQPELSITSNSSSSTDTSGKFIETISTPHTHEEFYDYYNNTANGFINTDYDHLINADTTSIFLHKNSNTNSKALFIIHHDASGDGSNGFSVKTSFSKSITPSEDIILKDDPDDSNDSYTSSYVEHEFTDDETDGVVIDWEAFATGDTTITVTNTSYSGTETVKNINTVRWWTDLNAYEDAAVGDDLTFTKKRTREELSEIAGYLVHGDNYIAKFDEEDHLEWKTSVPSSVTIHRMNYTTDKVFIGCEIDKKSGRLKALDMSTGDELWSKHFDAPRQDDWEAFKFVGVETDRDYLYASYVIEETYEVGHTSTDKLHLDDGAPVTDSNDDPISTGAAFGQLAYDGEYLYGWEGSWENIIKIDPTDLSTVWQQHWDDDFYSVSLDSSIGFTDDLVVVNNMNHEKYYGVNKSDGSIAWKCDVPANGTNDAPAQITRRPVDGSFYAIGTDTDHIWEFDAETGEFIQEHGCGYDYNTTTLENIYYDPEAETFYIAPESLDELKALNKDFSKSTTFDLSFSPRSIGGTGWSYFIDWSDTTTSDGSGSGDQVIEEPPKMLGHWRMEHPNTSKVLDATHRGLNGSLKDNWTYSTDSVLGTNSLDITAGHANIPYLGILDTLYQDTGTVSFWFKRHTSSSFGEFLAYSFGNQGFDGTENGWTIEIDGNNTVHLNLYSDGQAMKNLDVTTVNDNTWYFLAFRLDGLDKHVFIGDENGNYDKHTIAASNGKTDFSGTDLMRFGHPNLNNSNILIDEVRAFDDPLDDSTVKKLFKKEDIKTYNDYKFNVMTYEVNTVVHDCPTTAPYTTRINVSPLVHDTDILTIDKT